MPTSLSRASLKDVHIRGVIGAEIDKVLDARILSAHARDCILSEARDAFRTRIDDRLHDGRGTWQGEFWGKWVLSAIAAQMYTGSVELRDVIARSAAELLATQDKSGYIGTYHDSTFVKGNCWNVWCRKYTLWGLIESYELLRDKRILDAAMRFMDHLMTEVGPRTVNMRDTGNFVGLPSSSILTPLIRLHQHTSDPRYLDYAEYIVSDWGACPGQPPDIVAHGLQGTPIHKWFPDAGKWTKAYEFISCVEGLVDLYCIVGNRDYLLAAENIHAAIRDHERVITGGIGYHDKLANAAKRTDGLNEPCDVVYWERLSARLLEISANPVYADEIERLAYNVLLTSVNDDGSWALRRLGLSEPHLIAPLHCGLHHHQCCVANLPRGLLQLAEVALMPFSDSDGLALNLYLPGEFTLRLHSGGSITLAVETAYPADGSVAAKIVRTDASNFPIAVRLPPWAEHAELCVNGERQVRDGSVGAYAMLKRRWQAGDTIQLDLDVAPRRVEFPGVPAHVAVMAGPLVLARSSLLEEGDIHGAVSLAEEASGRLKARRLPAKSGTWLTFEVETADGGGVPMCDYASTGKAYRKPADPAAWKLMLDLRTAEQLRVWMPAEEGT